MPETRKGSKGEIQCDESLRLILENNKLELLNEMKKINASLDFIRNKVNKVEDTLTMVLETQAKQDLEIKRLKEEMAIVRESHADILNEVADRDRRKNNLIIAGLPERDDGTVDDRRKWDMESVEKLFRELCNLNADIVSGIHRIGRVNSNRPRLLKVICRDVDSKISLLRKSRDLKKSQEFMNVYVNSDLTPAQRMDSKRLREEWKARRGRGEDVIIRNGRVIERSQNFL